MTNEFYEIVAQIALELSPNRITALSKAAIGLDGEDLTDAIMDNCGPNCNKKLFSKLLQVLQNDASITGTELSSSLLAAHAVASQTGRYGQQELLWTGPATASVPVRQTEEALLQVIRTAKKDLFIVSYVAYAIPNVMDALQDAQERNVIINFLLEQTLEAGGKVSVDSIAIFKKKLPAAHFHIWQQPNAKVPAAVHAKCAVADGEIAMITSANLTGKAMDENMEIGLLLTGGSVPKQLSAHLHALITEKIIVEA